MLSYPDMPQHRKVYNNLPKPPPDLLRKSKRLGLRKSPRIDDRKSSPKAIFLNLKQIIINALKEDTGKNDITTQTFISEGKNTEAVIIAKEACVVCGLEIASLVFATQERTIRFNPLVSDGDFVKKGVIIACLSGKAKGLLTAERVALNFLSFLSGIATKTRQFVEAIKPYKTKIIDTRKTIPGFRHLEKYAVRTGGGFNHRFTLDEMIMVKDNHLKLIGGYQKMKKINYGYKLELEVENLREFNAALKLNPDIIMLDNMSIKEIKKAVQIRNNLWEKAYPRIPELEASGGITLKNVKKVAACGVDMISIGELTHSVKSVDLSLEIL